MSPSVTRRLTTIPPRIAQMIYMKTRKSISVARHLTIPSRISRCDFCTPSGSVTISNRRLTIPPPIAAVIFVQEPSGSVTITNSFLTTIPSPYCSCDFVLNLPEVSPSLNHRLTTIIPLLYYKLVSLY